MKRKKLLFLIGQLGYGGSEKQLTMLARKLQGEFEITVICVSPSIEPYGPILEEAGIRVLAPLKTSRVSRLVWLVSLLRSLKPDLVMAFAVRNVNALLVGIVLNCPLIVTERSVGVWKSRLYLAIDRVLYARSSRILTNSVATLRFVEQRFPRYKTKLSVIYNGIEEMALPESPEETEPGFNLTMVAGLRPWKGHLFMIDAIEKLSLLRKDFCLYLVGDGPERQQIENAVNRKGLHAFVVFEGWQENPSPFLARAQISLNLSSHESLSNSVMEGMMLAKPSIVTDVGGNTELVRHGLEGRVVRYGDVDQLIEELQYLMSNPSICAAYGRSARRRMIEEFSVDNMVKGTRSLIEKVLGKSMTTEGLVGDQNCGGR